MRLTLPHIYRSFVALLTLALVAGLSLSLAGPAEARKYNSLVNFDSVRGQIIQPEMFGLHVKNEQYGVWPSIPFGSLRLWDNDVAWSQIEVAPVSTTGRTWTTPWPMPRRTVLPTSCS